MLQFKRKCLLLRPSNKVLKPKFICNHQSGKCLEILLLNIKDTLLAINLFSFDAIDLIELHLAVARQQRFQTLNSLWACHDKVQFSFEIKPFCGGEENYFASVMK